MSVDFTFFEPVSSKVLDYNTLLHNQALGKKIKIHSTTHQPTVEGVKVALFGILETRNASNYIGEAFHIDEIRKSLYALFPGNWPVEIADLGNLITGSEVKDTYAALSHIIKELVSQNIIPIILGGSQDLTYAIYRAYDFIKPMVNIVNIDKSFDLGDSSKPIMNTSFVGKIILEKPYNLFNYSTIGYQTYFNSQEEIDLMESLHFEAYRLGEICRDVSQVEPILRDANIVSLDLKSVKSSELSESQRFSPNGFDGKEICAISRYAGISNKVSSFGIFDYKPSVNDESTSMLVAQIVWYFIEGVACRIADEDFSDSSKHTKYTVIIEGEELVFYKSLKTSRWWIEMPFLKLVDNKLKQHTLLPCMYEDYVNATKGKIPERWYKALRKN